MTSTAASPTALLQDTDELPDEVVEELADATLSDAEDLSLAEEWVADLADVPDRDLEDFDFAEVVAGLPVADVPTCLAELARYRAPYIRAARRGGRRSPEADFYNVVNGPLFNRRTALRDRVAELDAVVPADRDAAHRVAGRRARRELEMLTELIVRFNYGMTRKYVRLFTSNTSREDSEDFQGAALLGLMTSIDTFDPAKGKFGSWAYKRIQREVLRAVRDADYKSMNHGDFERRPDILRAYAQLAGPNDERTPSFEEVAAAANCTVDLVRRVLAAPRLDSIHAAVGADGETELGELLPDNAVPIDDQVLTQMDIAALVQFGLSALEPREHYVLARRFGLDGEPVQCLSSIGKQLRLSREAVRQIESKGLARLLHPSVLSQIVRHGRPVPQSA